MLCKQETHGDPRACLKVGAAVSDCASEYFTAAINRCGEGIRFDPGHESGEVESQSSTEAQLCIGFGSNRKKNYFPTLNVLKLIVSVVHHFVAALKLLGITVLLPSLVLIRLTEKTVTL